MSDSRKLHCNQIVNMYNFTYSMHQPGFIFILCDLNEKMKSVYEQMQIAVQGIITDYLNGCVSGCSVKNRVFISVIGYGNQEPHVIREGWADEWLCIMREWHRSKCNIFHEELGTIYDCYNMWEYITKELRIIDDTYASQDGFNVLSPSIINITNRIPLDFEMTAIKINELIAFTIQGYNVAIGHCILQNKYDNLDDVILPTTNIVPYSKLFSYWFYESSIIENIYDNIGNLQVPRRNIIMTHSGMHASAMAHLTIGS